MHEHGSSCVICPLKKNEDEFGYDECDRICVAHFGYTIGGPIINGAKKVHMDDMCRYVASEGIRRVDKEVAKALEEALKEAE